MRLARTLPVGKIVRVHGLAGKVLAAANGESLAGFEPGVRVRAEWAGTGREARILTLEGTQPHGRGVVVKFEEIADHAGATAIVGAELLAEREVLSPLAPGEHYCEDLIGLAVRDGHGNTIGVVVKILSNGCQELLEVRAGDGRTHLVPFVHDIVKEVAPEGGFLIVDLPEGMIE